jgi:aryl-alcohol dehydrogenase-like predicted oxidoreductase
LQTAALGKTGIEVTRLGAGLAEIGEEHTLDELSHVSRVLNAALDGGINFLDTAPCYFDSEQMVGRTIAHRRDDFFLATKCGHPTRRSSGQPWTAGTIRETLEGSLRRLRTDYVDLLQLHSCGVDVLERGEVIDLLVEARQQGKTRFIGYSGDNEAALWAVESGLFDTLQTSFSVADQHARTRLFRPAEERGMGIIVKRPIASGAWGVASSPSADLRYNPHYADEYFERARRMAAMGPVHGAPDDRILTSLGFVLAHDEVDTAILGTRNPAHMEANQALLERLPIPDQVVRELRRRFDEAEDDWRQLN